MYSMYVCIYTCLDSPPGGMTRAPYVKECCFHIHYIPTCLFIFFKLYIYIIVYGGRSKPPSGKFSGDVTLVIL